MNVIQLKDDETCALNTVLTQLARWIKAHRERYAPITAISKIPDYRDRLRFLKREGYIRTYKNGAVVIIEQKGWAFISSNYPAIIMRYQKYGKLTVKIA